MLKEQVVEIGAQMSKKTDKVETEHVWEEFKKYSLY